jgi:hypothetical protein
VTNLDAQRLMHFLANLVTPFLQERGYHRRGQQYLARRGPNSTFIRFQRREGWFTCDLGVISALLLTECGLYPSEHLTVRLGPLMFGYDKWWNLADGDEAIAADFIPALSNGLDYVEPFATDEGLRDEFLKDATIDSRGIAPITAAWLTAFSRTIGVPAWAIGIPIRVRNGSVVYLEAETKSSEIRSSRRGTSGP